MARQCRGRSTASSPGRATSSRDARGLERWRTVKRRTLETPRCWGVSVGAGRDHRAAMGGACISELTTRAWRVKQANHARKRGLPINRHGHRELLMSLDTVHQSCNPSQGHLVLAVARQGLISQLLPYQLARTVIGLFESSMPIQLQNKKVLRAASQPTRLPWVALISTCRPSHTASTPGDDAGNSSSP